MLLKIILRRKQFESFSWKQFTEENSWKKPLTIDPSYSHMKNPIHMLHGLFRNWSLKSRNEGRVAGTIMQMQISTCKSRETAFIMIIIEKERIIR